MYMYIYTGVAALRAYLPFPVSFFVSFPVQSVCSAAVDAGDLSEIPHFILTNAT